MHQYIYNRFWGLPSVEILIYTLRRRACYLYSSKIAEPGESPKTLQVSRAVSDNDRYLEIGISTWTDQRLFSGIARSNLQGQCVLKELEKLVNGESPW